jgi:ornithine cyclodeaminase
MREFPDSLFSLLDEVVIDTNLASKESGDLRIPLMNKLINKNQLYRLGQLISGEKEIDPKKTTLFKSVGMALFDLLAAETIYKKAKEKGLGTEVDF